MYWSYNHTKFITYLLGCVEVLKSGDCFIQILLVQKTRKPRLITSSGLSCFKVPGGDLLSHA
jgi:hypothetical protein